MDGLTADLNDLLHYETCSLMAFMGEVTPYVSPDMFLAWKTVQAMALRTSDRAQRITAMLASQRWPAVPGAYDSHVAELHYVKLDTLLPMLVREAVDNVATLERAIEHGDRYPGITTALTEMLREHRDELTELEGCLSGKGA